MDIKIKYDGKYPNLCSGHLFVYIDEVEYDFGTHCLSSEGSCGFTEEWDELVEKGLWSICKFPEEFPEVLKLHVINAVNEKIRLGCCGGCL